MIQVATTFRQFTTGQVSRLLGMYVGELVNMRREGKGPIYTGIGEYVSYREDHVKLWALENVLAPIRWFDRFDNIDPRNVKRCSLMYRKPYYELDWFYQMPFVIDAGKMCDQDGTFKLYHPGSAALIAARAETKSPA